MFHYLEHFEYVSKVSPQLQRSNLKNTLWYTLESFYCRASTNKTLYIFLT